MRKAFAIFLIIGASLFLLPDGASAISNGAPDGTNHPNVGFLAYSFYDDIGFQICSGTLVAPDLFLTSAHCVVDLLPLFDAGILHFWIGFEPAFDREDMSRWILATEIHPNPVFDLTHWSDSGDLALVRFDPSAVPAGVVLPPPARLPIAGLLDELKADSTLREQRFTIVGYGLSVVFDRGRPFFFDPRDRYVATAQFQSLGPGYFHILEIPQVGNGGICFGDSGGPFFLGETDIVAGVTGLTDAQCRAFGGALRLDTESSRSFLGQFLTLP